MGGGKFHTNDNFDRFGDPDFTRHHATASVWAIAALLLTTTPIPLVDMSYYSDQVEQAIDTVHKAHLTLLKEKNISLSECLTSQFISVCDQ